MSRMIHMSLVIMVNLLVSSQKKVKLTALRTPEGCRDMLWYEFMYQI